VDPALNLETDSDGSEFECFMPCGSAGSWPASDVGEGILSRVPPMILIFDCFVPV
jgi:hypothetical protein